MKVMNINDKDVCLTLTSGGCNSLNLVRRVSKRVMPSVLSSSQNIMFSTDEKF